ncbi:MAG: cytochrome c4 [Gammaproteobacteria bacterium]|nr:cytochrome c4 [Gammaproteobacteria bacterium]
MRPRVFQPEPGFIKTDNMRFLATTILLWLLACGLAWAQGDAARGQQKAQVCVACHGADGNSTNPEWPKIAGQSAQYIYRHLQFFRDGQRVNPLMNPLVTGMSDADLHDLAAFYESMKVSPGAADKDLVEAGRTIYQGGNPETGVAACIACHGPRGNGNPAAVFPKLSHQHALYTANRLRNYRDGAYSYPGVEIMNSVSAALSDEEIEAVASYIQGLH